MRAMKTACCFWTIKKSSAYQHRVGFRQTQEKDPQQQMLGMKCVSDYERAKAVCTDIP